MAEENKQNKKKNSSNETYNQGAVFLSSIISRAFKESAHAQMDAAKTMKDYLLQTMFKNKELQMLSFTYFIDGQKHLLKMPLASVIQAQFIQIKDVEIDFAITVQSTQNSSGTKRINRVVLTKSRALLRKQALIRLRRGTIAKSEVPKQHHAINVKIKGQNSDISGGMARLLQLATTYGTSIKPIE